MALELNARNNTNYGGTLINQKYSPLENLLLASDPADYRGLFTARIGSLTGLNAYPPNAINFYGNLPIARVDDVPMVVISSNRGTWMRELLDNARKHGRFAYGYLTTNTFKDGPVPWYVPARSGVNRVYVVVHWSEYEFYAKQLEPYYNQFTVVGFEFAAAHPALDIVGLGASRYAAIQFLIHRGYHRAWVVDDNVVNINGFPQTPAPVEAHMPVGSNIWGIGFQGATVNITLDDLKDGEVTFREVPYNFGNTVPGLLQQVVLWNIDNFRNANLNFCPLFVTSNEDIALCNFLQASGRDERIISACHVIKLSPRIDGDANRGGTVAVPRRRNRLAAIFSNIEDDIPFVPVDGGAQRPLSEYIAETVLPNALDKARSTAPVVQSKAVEQFMARATRQGWYPAVAFNPYNGPANVQTLLPGRVPVGP